MSPSFIKGRLNFWIAPVVILMLLRGVWQQRDLQRLRVEHASLLDLARSRGIDPGVPDALPTKPYPRRDKGADARALAAALIRRSEKGYTERTDWGDQVDLADQFEGLNPAQLREMIEIFRKDDQMPDLMRLWVTLDLLQRLAKDFPEEAMGHMVEIESRLPEGFARHNIWDCLVKIGTCFGEKSPDAAWKWYVDTRLVKFQDSELGGFDQVREAVLGGIAKRDPALALRHAEEVGGEKTGIYFLGFYCTTLDQRVAALKALRVWSGGDAGKKVKLESFIKDQTLKRGYGETVRFEGVTTWIEQAGLTTEEIGFLGDRSKVDLCGSIDPRDVGKWIEWLDENFPVDLCTTQIKHLIEDGRTADAGKAWLATLPPQRAAAFKERLAGE